MKNGTYDVIILGSGPAGLTAGLYTARASLKTLILAGSKWGGQLQLTTEVENYPGFPEGILGPALMKKMRDQTARFGAEIIDKEFVRADFTKQPFVVKSPQESYLGKTVIVATGADTKWLGIPGEEKMLGRGVSSCAPCDGFFYRGKRVVVVGGGDSAMEEALFLTKFATEVFIIHRRDQFRASKIMQDRVKANPKIHLLLNTTVAEVQGVERVEKLRVRITLTDTSKIAPEQLRLTILTTDSVSITGEIPIDGMFVAVGHLPNTDRFKGLNLDKRGFVKREEKYLKEGLLEYFTATNIKGVFTAGDVHDYRYKQAVTAAGFGCMAAMDAEKYLEENPN